jgi:hypothetical protein
MSRRGTHRSGHEKDLKALAGVTSFCLGVPLLISSVTELLRYSPYEDPGAGTAGLWLGIAAVLAICIPVLALVILIVRLAAADYLAWRRSLSPVQRALVGWGEFAALLGAHLLIRHHHRETSARLTASVMGDTPEVPS